MHDRQLQIAVFQSAEPPDQLEQRLVNKLVGGDGIDEDDNEGADRDQPRQNIKFIERLSDNPIVNQAIYGHVQVLGAGIRYEIALFAQRERSRTVGRQVLQLTKDFRLS